MRRSALLLAVVGMFLIGVVPAGAVDPVYEVEFNTQTGTTSSWTLVGTATGNSVSAEGEIVYTWTDGTIVRSMKLHDLKCLVVVPSINLSYDTDFNVMVIGRMEVLLDPTGYWDSANTWGYMAYAPDEERFSGTRPLGVRDHHGEPPCDPWEYNNWSEVGYTGMTWTGNGYLTSGYVTVNEVEPTPPKKLKFSETYKLPADRLLVPDQGWLNVGCGGGDFEWPTVPGVYETPGTLYEMYSGKLDATWEAKYAGQDADGNWLYDMTQDFDWKKAVFESGTNWLHYEAEDEWYYDWVGSGDYFDTVATGEMDALVRVINPYAPIDPGNVEPVDGSIHMAFEMYDETGTLVDWLHVEGTFTDGEFVGTQEGTCIDG